jgi:hypothetical protein
MPVTALCRRFKNYPFIRQAKIRAEKYRAD